METRENIVCGSLELFFRYGIKSVSIDDIANYLGISKKTFYHYFENKDEAIEVAANSLIERSKSYIVEIANDKADSLSKLFSMYQKLISQFNTCNPRFIYDIKKYYPDIFQIFTRFENNNLYEMITNIIKQGKEEGFFRKEIDEKNVFKFYQSRFTAIIDGSLLPGKRTSDPVFFDFIIMGVIGITTIEGHKKLELKLNDLKK
jgi:AcrR family transcriptional regulator